MKKIVLTLVATISVSAWAAEKLVVDASNSPLTLSSDVATTNHYTSAEINGILNVTDKVTLYFDTATGPVDIGTQPGVEAILNFNGEPKFTRLRHPGTTSSRFGIRIGAAANGGSGKITVTGTEQTVPLTAAYLYKVYDGYGHITLRHQTLSVLAGAAPNGKLSGESAASDVIDAVELNKGGMVGISSMYNASPWPARVLFKGGAISYNNCWEGDGFKADATTRWILESVEGNPIVFHSVYGPRTLNAAGRVLETRGSGDVIFTGTGETSNYNVYTVNSGMQWNHGGNVVIGDNARFYAGAACVSPCGSGRGGVVIKTDSQPKNAALSARYDPHGNGQCLNSLEIVGKGGWVTNSSTTTATLTFGTNDLNGTFRVPRLGGSLAIAKMGTGTLTITNTPAVPALNVTGGMVDVCRADAGPVTMSTVTLGAAAKVTIKTATTVDRIVAPAEGAELIVDGVQLSLRQNAPTSLKVTLKNGGTLVYAFAPGADETVRYAPAESADSSCDVVKTGAGNLLIEAASGTLKSLAVEAGTVKLGTFGTDNRFWRVTYKQAMTAGQSLYIGPLRLFTKNNAFADGGATRDRETVPNYVDKTGTVSEPSQLAARQFFCSTTDYTAPGGSGGHVIVGPAGQFYCSSVYSCCFTNIPKLDDPDTWITMTWRIPDAATVGYPFAYDLKSQWEGSGSRRPGAWKLESSPTGLDGSWETMDEKSGIKGSWGQSWYNGQNGGAGESANPWPLPTAISTSLTPLASVGSLSVASGATFDASLVTGGQEIADLTVDAIGGGSLVNVKFAAEGVLRLVNASSGKLPANYRIPLTFADASATGNAANWKLCVNGIPSDRKLGWEDGGLVVLPKGLVILVK